MSKRRRTLWVSLSALAVIAVLAERGPAQSFTLNKCAAGKKKCAATKLAGLLKCHVVAETKGVLPSDNNCIAKAVAKFDGGADPTKGCFAKLENKYAPASDSPCLTYGDSDSVEAVIDPFVDAVVHAVDPSYPDTVVNKCSAGKKKCVSSKVVGLLKCHQKAETKGISPNDKGCLDKVKAKFDGGTDPSKGCFAKLEARGGCPTSNDTAQVESQVDAFVDALVALLDHGGPPPTTTSTGPIPTTTSTTTSTKPSTTSTSTSTLPTTTSTSTTSTSTTSSTSTSTLGGGATCAPAGVNAKVKVPYAQIGAPLLSGIRLRVRYPAKVGMPTIPGTNFVDSSRLTSLTGVAGGFLIGQDIDTNSDMIEDTLDLLYGVSGTTFPSGDFVRALFDCAGTAFVSPGDFQCVVTSASDQVGNDLPNPGSIPCAVVEVTTP